MPLARKQSVKRFLKVREIKNNKIKIIDMEEDAYKNLPFIINEQGKRRYIDFDPDGYYQYGCFEILVEGKKLEDVCDFFILWRNYKIKDSDSDLAFLKIKRNMAGYELPSEGDDLPLPVVEIFAYLIQTDEYGFPTLKPVGKLEESPKGENSWIRV